VNSFRSDCFVPTGRGADIENSHRISIEAARCLAGIYIEGERKTPAASRALENRPYSLGGVQFGD